jgi:hypothetical protein
MSITRNVLRNKAKKIYKEKIKNIPRKNRASFSQFFKEFQKTNQTVNPVIEADNDEDFNFDDLINTNEIDNDDDVIISESEEE